MVRPRPALGASMIMLALCFLAPDAEAQNSCVQGFEATVQDAPSALQLLSDCLSDPTVMGATRGQALEYRAWVHWKRGSFSQAAIDQESSFSFLPQITYRSLINHTLFLRRAKRVEESLVFAKLAEAIETASGSTTSMMTQYHLGWSYLEMERYTEAVEAFTRGIPYQQDFSAVYWLRSIAREKLGDSEGVRADLTTLRDLMRTSKGREELGSWHDAIVEKLQAYEIPLP